MTPDQLPTAITEMVRTWQAGDVKAALAQAENILKASPGEPNASQVLGITLLQQGRAAEALPHLQAAYWAASEYPPILNMLGVAHKQLGRRDQARKLFHRAIELAADFADARLNLAQLDLDEGHPAKAMEGFEAVLERLADNVTALVGKARSALLLHENDIARDCAEQALSLQPAHALAKLTLAEVRMRFGDFEGTIEIAEPFSADPNASAVNRAFAAGFAADAHDRLGRYNEAFVLYALANDLQAQQFANIKDRTDSPFSRQNIDRLSRRLDENGLPPALAVRDDEPMPVFLVGFPRSGTTLLEQILMSHPKIESFGEQSALASCLADLYVGADAESRWDSLDDEGAAARREKYWQEVAGLGTLLPGQVLLDKLPLNIVFLPAVARVFPRAKILFAVRDPRDVVLSCFQQRFGMNTAMYELLRLDTAARYYDQVMGLAKKTRALHDFPMHDVRYEDVIADIEGKARKTIEFLGLDWDPAVLEYREKAKSRAINTPSVVQVVEPIYTSSQGKWQNYEAQLGGIMDRLAPWVQHWGYES